MTVWVWVSLIGIMLMTIAFIGRNHRAGCVVKPPATWFEEATALLQEQDERIRQLGERNDQLIAENRRLATQRAPNPIRQVSSTDVHDLIEIPGVVKVMRRGVLAFLHPDKEQTEKGKLLRTKQFQKASAVFDRLTE